MGENTAQKNLEYGHFSRSVYYKYLQNILPYIKFKACFIPEVLPFSWLKS